MMDRRETHRHAARSDVSGPATETYLWARPLGRCRSSAGGDTPPAPRRIPSLLFVEKRRIGAAGGRASGCAMDNPTLPPPATFFIGAAGGHATRPPFCRTVPHRLAPSRTAQLPFLELRAAPSPRKRELQPPLSSLHDRPSSRAVPHRPAPYRAVPHRPPPCLSLPHPHSPSRILTLPPYTLPRRPPSSCTVLRSPAPSR